MRSCQRRGCRTRGQSGGRRARESVRNGERRRKHARSARAHRFVCRAGHPGRGAEPRRPPRPALATRLDTLSWSVNRNPTVFFARAWRHVQSAFFCMRSSQIRDTHLSKTNFFSLVCQVRADRLARLSGATMSTQGDGDHPMDGSTHDATESVGGACLVRRRCLTPAPRAPCRRSNARFVQKSLFVSVTRGSLDLGTPSNP